MTTPAEAIRADNEFREPLLPPTQANSNDADVQTSFIEAVDPVVIESYEPHVPQDEQSQTRSEASGTEAKCQDPFFAVLFLAQLATVLVLACLGLQELIAGNYFDLSQIATFDISISTDDTSDDPHYEIDTTRFILFHTIVAAGGIGWSFAALFVYSAFTQFMVQISLLVSPTIFFALAIWSLATSSVTLAAILVLFGLFGAFYAYSVWHRIPFAAANLSTAMAAVRNNFGLVFLSFSTVVKTWIWTFAFGLAALFVYFHTACYNDCVDSDSTNDQHNDPECETECDHFEIWLLVMLLSYFWTYGVLKYMLHTNVAGVVGSWWFVPAEASACCSQALCDSMYRTTTYSFGSICFGALVLSMTQLLQVVVRRARQEHDQRHHGRGGSPAGGSILFCLLECIIRQLQRLVQYVNKWAFVYVGIYGYDYLTAGSKVYRLFQARGWSVILNDVLVSRGLQIATLLISVSTGLTSCIMYIVLPGWLDGYAAPSSSAADTYQALKDVLANDGNTTGIHRTGFWLAFATGFGYGALLSSVLLKVVSSAVESVIVCFCYSLAFVSLSLCPDITS
mmetsp:Transcript_17579/g.49682  ORF Transcript_17579/g.49682 Transcript_17579/m.49682 type:complete len:566 (+) Transcript_17579:254-1951(+)